MSIDEKALEAAAKKLAAWIRCDYDDLSDRDISADYPDWTASGLQGGKPAVRKAAQKIVTAYLAALSAPDVAGPIAWCNEAARYFENRPTGGEDAENARKAASVLESLSAKLAESERKSIAGRMG